MSFVGSGVRPVEPAEGDVLLDVRDVSVNFEVAKRRVVHAVDHVSFRIARGSTFGLIGESGSGKSTLARMIVGLVKGEGDVLLDGEPLNRKEDRHRGGVRKVQMVVQDPHASLDPRMTVGASVAEPLRVAGVKSRTDRREQVIAMMERVGLTADQARRYPHEMSGGQKQRVSIARALVAEPELLICDESVSSLDVALQAEILNLLADLRTDFGLTMLFISHDLGVVGHVAERIGVMYLGRIVEIGNVEELLNEYHHPYTRALIESRPSLAHAVDRTTTRLKIEGEIPSALAPPSGCHFRTRCPYAQQRCEDERPELQAVSETGYAACHFADQLFIQWADRDQRVER